MRHDPGVRRWAAVASISVFVVVVLLVVVSTDGSPDARPGVAIRDSAGIRLIENLAPVWEPGSEWSLSPDDVVSIGVVDGEQPYLFTFVQAAYRLHDGSIVAVDQPAQEIRLFDPEGVHRRTFGGAGAGPGELSSVISTGISAADTIVVWDPVLYRLSWFNAGGDFVRDEDLRGRPAIARLQRMLSPYDWRVLHDGSIVYIDMNMERDPTFIETWRLTAFVLDHGERFIPFHEYPRRRYGVVNGQSVSNPFSAAMTLAVREVPFVTVYVNGPVDAWEVRAFDRTGRLCQIVRAAVPRVAINSRIRSEVRDSLGGHAFDQLEIPDSTPPISGMHTDAAGRLWVERWRGVGSAGAGMHDVFDVNGRWLGPVAIPAEYGRILWIGEDHVVTRVVDELGVQYVHVYALDRRADAGREPEGTADPAFPANACAAGDYDQESAFTFESRVR